MKMLGILLLVIVLFAVLISPPLAAEALSATESGVVWAWGGNYDGQLGNGSNKDSNFPVLISGLNGVVKVATGYDGHSLALKSEGSVWAWGSNACGQLGDGTNRSSNIPVRVAGLSGVIGIDTGGSDSGGCSLALKADGTVWGWGENRDGQLCNDTRQDSNVPVMINGLTGITAIAAGDDYCMALKNDGTVWSWGENHTHGKLGNGTNIDPPRGELIPVTDMTTAADIDASIEHSLSLTGDGRVWAWGGNFSGQLGTTESEFMFDRYMPVNIIGLTEIVAIAAGDLHNLALKSDGTVYAWGANSAGQLGNGTFSTFYSFVMPVKNMDGVVAIAAGGGHSLAIKSDGTVWAWGSNTSGELGDGTNQDSNLPVQVRGISVATAIAAGGRQSLAVVTPSPAPVPSTALIPGATTENTRANAASQISLVAGLGILSILGWIVWYRTRKESKS